MDTHPSFGLEERASWVGYLREHGYVVVRGVLTQAQCDAAIHDLWEVMEALGGVRRADPSTWGVGANWPPMLHGGMIQYLGHTPVQWRLRELCAPVFARYYEVDEHALASSFDGLCFMHGARGYTTRGELVGFLHTDQGPRRDYEWSVQGIVNLAPSGPDDGGLVVVPGSHREHQRFFDGHPSREAIDDDWYRFTEKEREAYRERALKVCAGPGDVLLWDSRTFHGNTVPARRDATRVCTYVCMLPAERVPPRVRAKRQAGWEARRTSNHHPGDGFKLFPSLPRFAGSKRDELLAKVRALQPRAAPTALERALVCGVG